jgi:hypothetical protein
MSGTITVSETGGEPERDLFMVTISATCVTTNESGRLVPERISTRRILEECAAENMLAARDLVLVYDVQADAIVAVNRTSGATACTVATLTGGVSIESPDGNRRERQAFLAWEGSEEVNGSIVGTERSTRRTDGTLAKFSFRGSLQLGLQAYEQQGGELEPPKVCKGSFSTGRRFVP